MSGALKKGTPVWVKGRIIEGTIVEIFKGKNHWNKAILCIAPSQMIRRQTRRPKRG